MTLLAIASPPNGTMVSMQNVASTVSAATYPTKSIHDDMGLSLPLQCAGERIVLDQKTLWPRRRDSERLVQHGSLHRFKNDDCSLTDLPRARRVTESAPLYFCRVPEHALFGASCTPTRKGAPMHQRREGRGCSPHISQNCESAAQFHEFCARLHTMQIMAADEATAATFGTAPHRVRENSRHAASR